MDTVTVNGVEVPLTEVVAYFAQKDTHAAEATRQKQALAQANSELEKASSYVEAITRAKEDPSYARDLVDAFKQYHEGSAYFSDEPTPPAPKTEDPPVTDPNTLPAPPVAL